MKKIIIYFLILSSLFSLHAETYEVLSVIGKVSYEKSGKWKNAKTGENISDECNIKIEDSSSITFSVNEKRVTLRGPCSNVLATLLKERNLGKKSATNTSVKKGSTVDTSKKASKGVATASSRASEAQGAAILDEE